MGRFLVFIVLVFFLFGQLLMFIHILLTQNAGLFGNSRFSIMYCKFFKSLGFYAVLHFF